MTRRDLEQLLTSFGPGISQRVLDALRSVDRRTFLPEAQREHAMVDRPLPIGFGQTCSQPRTVADMLTLLDVRDGDRVLDVGSGSGWTAALLGELVGRDGTVVGVELVAELAERAAAAVDAHGSTNVRVRAADPDRLGAPDDGPFDRILVSAGADDVPGELVAQLRPGGVMVVPVAGRMLRISLAPDGETSTTDHGAYAFVPLIT